MNKRLLFAPHKNKIPLLVAIGLVVGAILAGILVSISTTLLSSVAILVWLVVPIGIVMVFWFSKNPDKFIIFIIIIVPFENFILKWLPLKLQTYARFGVEGLIYAVFLLVLANYWDKRGLKWPRNILNVPLLIFLGFAFLSMISNNVPFYIFLLSLKNLLRYVFLYYMISLLGFQQSYIKKLTLLMISMAAIQSILGIAEEIIGFPMSHFLKSTYTGFSIVSGIENTAAAWAKSKPSGTIGLYSTYGIFSVFWAIFTFALILKSPSKNNRYKFLFILLSAGIIVSRARTSWILLAIGVFAVMFYLKRHWFVTGIITSVVLVLIALLFGNGLNNLIFGPQGRQITNWDAQILSKNGNQLIVQAENITQRLGEIMTTEYWENSPRIKVFTITLPEILRKFPMLGLGPGTMGSEITGGGSTSPGYYPQFSHQDWLDVPANIIIWTADTGVVAMIAQFGILGVLPWFLFIWRLFNISLKGYKRAKTPFTTWFSVGMMVNIILLSISELGNHYITYREYSVYFWIWAGFMVNISKFQDKELSYAKKPIAIPHTNMGWNNAEFNFKTHPET